MTPSVLAAIESLRKAYPHSEVMVLAEDGQGGAFVTVESVELGDKFVPETTWLGAHLPSNLPYADIYPVFMGQDVVRADGEVFVAPVTAGEWQSRPAWQISRRNNRLVSGQTAPAKFLKVIEFMKALP